MLRLVSGWMGDRPAESRRSTLDPQKIVRYACVYAPIVDATLVAAWWGVSQWGSVSGATPDEGGVRLLRTSVFKSALDLLSYRDISLANWGNVAFRDQRG